MKPSSFRVVLTADFYGTDGKLRHRDIGLSVLETAGNVEAQRFAEHRLEVEPDQLAGFHGAIVLTPRVTARSLAGCADLLAVARFGVGFDSVDVPACTAADVVMFTTGGAVDHSVAEATICWMLALSHQVRVKDRLAREARWEERTRYMGRELRDRTLGVIGFGGIGRAVVKMAAGFEMLPPLVFDPLVSEAAVAAAGARPVALDDLLRQADYVSLHCPLNEKTRDLLGARELALLKPTAYLLNTARGGIVNEAALVVALQEGRILGAAIDTFVDEPLTAPPPFAHLDNVLLAPHSIAWTDEMFRDIGRAACQGMVDLSQGRRPKSVINPEVFERPTFQQKWQRLCR